MNKLNLGCGQKYEFPKSDYINQDIYPFYGVDDVFDFNIFPWKYKDNQFEEIKIWNCLFLAKDFVRFMKEVWRVSKPNAKIIIQTQFFLST